MATIAKARDLWTCFADHAPDSSRSLISPHTCASSLQSVRCQNVALARIQLSCHSSTLTSSVPDPSTNASTIFLHQIPPPNPSTDATTICLFQLPPSCFTNASTKSRQQIPPPTPHASPQPNHFACFAAPCPPEGAVIAVVARGTGRHKASRLTANPDPDNHTRRSTGTWWVCMRVCVCVSVCCTFVCWCVLSIVRMLVAVPSPNGPTPLPIRATLQVVNQQFNGRSSTGILSCALPLDCDTVRISSRACCPLLLCPHRLALHSRHLGE